MHFIAYEISLFSPASDESLTGDVIVRAIDRHGAASEEITLTLVKHLLKDRIDVVTLVADSSLCVRRVEGVGRIGAAADGQTRARDARGRLSTRMPRAAALFPAH